MSKRRTAVGIAVLFALALSAFSAASASAAEETTAYTCVTDSNGDRFGHHCLEGNNGTGKSKHVEIKEGEETTITGTNERTAANGAGESTKAAQVSLLHGTISGLATELKCTTVHGENGTLVNKKAAGGEMFAHATGILTYSGCEVLKPAGKGCVVKNGKVTTKELTGTTLGQKMGALLKPASGTTFAEITIESCSVGALNNTFPVTGEFVAEISGATVTSTAAGTTAQTTLKFGGQKAGLEGALTLEGHKAGDTETHAITSTTQL